MKPNKEVIAYAEYHIKEIGEEKMIRKLSEAIHSHSEEDYAIGSIHQIYFMVRVLNYIKNYRK